MWSFGLLKSVGKEWQLLGDVMKWIKVEFFVQLVHGSFVYHFTTPGLQKQTEFESLYAISVYNLGVSQPLKPHTH